MSICSNFVIAKHQHFPNSFKSSGKYKYDIFENDNASLPIVVNCEFFGIEKIESCEHASNEPSQIFFTKGGREKFSIPESLNAFSSIIDN